eukprot:UN4718
MGKADHVWSGLVSSRSALVVLSSFAQWAKYETCEGAQSVDAACRDADQEIEKHEALAHATRLLLAGRLVRLATDAVNPDVRRSHFVIQLCHELSGQAIEDHVFDVVRYEYNPEVHDVDAALPSHGPRSVHVKENVQLAVWIYRSVEVQLLTLFRHSRD